MVCVLNAWNGLYSAVKMADNLYTLIISLPIIVLLQTILLYFYFFQLIISVFFPSSTQYLKDCDVVVTMVDGRQIERGTHDELMALDQTYSNLIQTFHSTNEEEEEADEDMHGRLERALSTLSARSRAASVLSTTVEMEMPDQEDDGKTSI